MAGFGNKETNAVGTLVLIRGQAGWGGDVQFALSHREGSTEVRGAGCAQSGDRAKPLGLSRDGAVAFSSTVRVRQPPLEPFFIGVLLRRQLRAVFLGQCGPL